MFNIIKADLFRMRKSFSMIVFWLIIISMLVLLFIFNGEVSVGLNFYAFNTPKTDIAQLSQNIIFYYLLIIPVFTVIVSDLSKKTVKNTITSSVSRKMYYASKTVLCVIYGVFAFLIYDAGIYIFNRLVNGEAYSSDLTDYMIICLYHLPVIIMIISFLIMAAFVFGKASIFNACTIILPIATEIILSVFCQIEATQSFTKNYLLKYELSSMFSLLAANSDNSYRNNCFIISAIVSTAALILGYFAFRKKEIK